MWLLIYVTAANFLSGQSLISDGKHHPLPAAKVWNSVTVLVDS